MAYAGRLELCPSLDQHYVYRSVQHTLPDVPIFFGGEPLLHPQVLDFIRELKQRGFFCSLTTNGSFLQANAAQLCERKLDLLVVSIDGVEATHDQIRSPGVYKRAVSGIQEIIRMPDRPLVGISTIIMDINHSEKGTCPICSRCCLVFSKM
jgi:MoaA/NifB/PqqE/SkfB family radical SAM enzyme